MFQLLQKWKIQTVIYILNVHTLDLHSFISMLAKWKKKMVEHFSHDLTYLEYLDLFSQQCLGFSQVLLVYALHCHFPVTFLGYIMCKLLLGRWAMHNVSFTLHTQTYTYERTSTCSCWRTIRQNHGIRSYLHSQWPVCFSSLQRHKLREPPNEIQGWLPPVETLMSWRSGEHKQVLCTLLSSNHGVVTQLILLVKCVVLLCMCVCVPPWINCVCAISICLIGSGRWY